MTLAFLHTTDDKYYAVNDQGEAVKLDDLTALKEVPEKMASIDHLNHENRRYFKSPQTGFVFRKDGRKILRHITYTQGVEAECILTLKGDENLSGIVDLISMKDHHGDDDRFEVCVVHI